MKSANEGNAAISERRITPSHLERPETTNSGEFKRPTQKVLSLALQSSEVFQNCWDGLYAEIWNEADRLREIGDYENALLGYREAQSLVREAVDKGVDEDVVLLREAFVHYMIIQCYANIHKEPDLVMREFHNFGVTLYKFIKYVLKDFPEREDVIEQLDDLYKIDNYASVGRIQRCLSVFFKNRAESLTDRQLEVVWKCAYAITRFAGSLQDFFIKSTSLVDIGKRYYGICDNASRIAIDASNLIDPDIIESSDSLKTLKQLTDEWLDGYTEFLQDDLNFTLGAEKENDDAKKKKKNRSTMDLAEAKYLNEDIDISHPRIKKGLEFSLQRQIRRVVKSLFKGKTEYDEGVANLKKIVSRCEKYGFRNLAIPGYFFACRIALREGQIEDAKDALRNLISHDLQPVDKIGAESSYNERWYASLDAEVKLYQYKDKCDVVKHRDDTRKDVSDSGIDLDAYRPILQVMELEQIEGIFKRYKSDTQEKLPKLSFKPLDAKIYHILGQVALEKAKILGKEFHLLEDGEEKNRAGEELQKAFEEAYIYLCEAYAILANLDYNGMYLKNKISDSCEEMLALNKQILGEEKRDANLSSLKRTEEDKPEFDMDSFVKDYQVKKSADLIYNVISTYDISLPDNGFSVLSEGLQAIFQKMDSMVCSTYIVEGQTNNEMHQKAIENFKNSIGSEKMKNRTYNYHLPDGSIIEVFCMDEENDRYVLLEVDMKLTDNARALMSEILVGIKHFLRLKETVQKAEVAEEDDIEAIQEEYMMNLHELFISLMRQHPPTLRHSDDVGRMAEISANKINRVYGSNLNTKLAKYAGMTHDIGKIFSSALFVLNAPRKLQKFEYQGIQQHVVKGCDFLKHLKAFRIVPELVQLIAPHHVKYANDYGYPFKAPGSQIVTMPSQINEEFGIKPGDPDYMEGEMSKELALLARMIGLEDVVSAVRSWDRFYRNGPEPIDDFIMSIISRTGSDYDPEAVVLLFELLNNGDFDDMIAFTEEDKEYLHSVQGPREAYLWSDVHEFIEANRDELVEMTGVPLDYALGMLIADSQNEYTLTDKAVGRLICESMIQETGNREKAVETYKAKVEGAFGAKFKGWFDIAA